MPKRPILPLLWCLFMSPAAFPQGGIGLVIGGPPPLSSITIYDRENHKITFTLKGKPRLEILNGRLNIAFTSSKNEQLQIIGIEENLLKDTVLKSPYLQVIFINKDQSRTFVSVPARQKPTLVIKRKKSSDMIRISMHALIFLNNEEYRVEANISETLPKPQFQTTN